MEEDQNFTFKERTGLCLQDRLTHSLSAAEATFNSRAVQDRQVYVKQASVGTGGSKCSCHLHLFSAAFFLPPFWGLLGCCLLYFCLKPTLLPNQFLPSKKTELKDESTLLITLQILQGFPASLSIHSRLNTHRAPNYTLSSLIYSEQGNMMTTVQCSINS